MLWKSHSTWLVVGTCIGLGDFVHFLHCACIHYYWSCLLLNIKGDNLPGLTYFFDEYLFSAQLFKLSMAYSNSWHHTMIIMQLKHMSVTRHWQCCIVHGNVIYWGPTFVCPVIVRMPFWTVNIVFMDKFFWHITNNECMLNHSLEKRYQKYPTAPLYYIYTYWVFLGMAAVEYSQPSL